MRIVRDLGCLRGITQQVRSQGRRIGLVPTMGALHQGHLALVAAAQRVADTVAVSIFVNPLQFAAHQDAAAYPRDEAGDLGKLRDAGCGIVWIPSVAAMYPEGAATRIEVGGPAEGYEGAFRPGHFPGAATVCAKLFHQTAADVAVFGEKDWQQLQVIRRMVSDLDLTVRIVGHPTVREADGLACSSRNRLISLADRPRAALLPQTLTETVDALQHGGNPDAALSAAEARLRQFGFLPDYVALTEPETLRPWPAGRAGDARLLAAATLGAVRLIDNMPVRMPR